MNDFPYAEEVKKECEQIEKAEIGNPKTPLNRSPYLTNEVVNLINEGIGYKYHAAYVFDSAAAFFGRDNVGLPGVEHFFKVLGVIDRADAWEAVDFLNKRGGNVKFGKIAEPPSEEEWSKKDDSDVKVAFEKTLALAKVYYNCTNKAYETAKKEGDAHTLMFLKKSLEEVGEKMRGLAWYVTHLKAVKGDKHAIKNLDRELECKTCDLARAAGVEAVIPSRLQIGTVTRLKCTDEFALSWKFMMDEPEVGKKMVV
ncbi:probable ferritin-3, chloroplastic [Coccomyxa sp. Obi]|nr:probable ferritin-3, chloroplastic [Coccomyxa sp. Obi]